MRGAMTDRMRRRTIRRAIRHGAVDATSEPDPGPAPEAVFDRVTGPCLRRFAAGLPGARAFGEGA
jgi:hypothetical protein